MARFRGPNREGTFGTDSRTRVGHAGAALSKNTVLTSLDLTGNQLGDEGAGVIGRAVRATRAGLFWSISHRRQQITSPLSAALRRLLSRRP